MERFRGGLVSKAHRLLYHSTLGSRVINKKKRWVWETWRKRRLSPDSQGAVGRSNKRVLSGERCRRPWLVTNWATLPQKWPPWVLGLGHPAYEMRGKRGVPLQIARHPILKVTCKHFALPWSHC